MNDISYGGRAAPSERVKRLQRYYAAQSATAVSFPTDGEIAWSPKLGKMVFVTAQGQVIEPADREIYG